MNNFSIHNLGFFLAQSDMLPNTNLMHVLASQQSSRCGKIQMQDVTIEMYMLSSITFVKEIVEYRR
jgi:hypothetical protein